MNAAKAAWTAGWLVVAGLFAVAFVPPGAPRPREQDGSLAGRLLGSFGGLAASVQWVRVDLALRRGDAARAYARAETALRLAPQDPGGWIFLARHLLYERASLEREPDPVARAEWIRAGLETLERGERAVPDPAEIQFERGVALAYLASLADEDRLWPPSDGQAWSLAAEAFEAAAVHGYPQAVDAAVLALERAAESETRR